MGKLIFYVVDVFAEEKFAGNQLAVFRGGANLSMDQMQAIAREMHFSETTFIMSEEQRKGGYDVCIFTPAAEVPFAGHPTLGTAHIIRNEIIKDNPAEIILNLKAGWIPVTFRKNISWMKQISPEFGLKLDADAVAEVLGLSPSEIDDLAIVNFRFSQQFTQAIEAKQTAEQLALKAQRDLDRIKIEAQQKITQAQAEA